MRRKMGRVTDTEWLADNREYAHAMIRLCAEQADDELLALATRLAAMWAAAAPPPPRPLVAAVADQVKRSRQALEERYVGRLR